MFILIALNYGYNRFIDLLMEGKDKDKKYTDKDVIIKMIVFGIILFFIYHKCILYTIHIVSINVNE